MLYQVLVLGQSDVRSDAIKASVEDKLTELGIPPAHLVFVEENHSGRRDMRMPTISIFLGYDGASDAAHPILRDVLLESQTIVTVVSALDRVSRELPPSLWHINALEMSGAHHNVHRVSTLVLESFRLLRRERRLFISYKRSDSQLVANQLYDALDARGFDVFIDTRAVPPAVDFQAELWHRLSDSDLVVLIDTPGFRVSRWTTEELARANATNIQILHLLWPGQAEDSSSAFSYFRTLQTSDFAVTSATGGAALTDEAIVQICGYAEKLRARAIAARHRYLIDSFCDSARAYGLAPTVQPDRWISLELANGNMVAVVPTIGVPTSDRINKVFDTIASAGGGAWTSWVLYDDRGILQSWLNHLGWLDAHLPIRAVRMSAADKAIKGLRT